MSKRKLVLATLLATAGLVAGASSMALAHDGNHSTTPPSAPKAKAANATTVVAHTGHGPDKAAQKPGETATAAGNAAFFVADLNGRNEVPVPGGPAVGDRNGQARTVVRIQGNQLCFTTVYKGIAAPTAGHIHAGAAGVNGAIKVGFFGSALPGSVRAFTGCVTADAATLDAITANPEGNYVNIHTAEFPGGAVRGQLRKLDRAVDLLSVLRGPNVALMDGAQETPALGDADGRATGFLRARGNDVNYAFTWSGIAPPTKGHLHAGEVGVAGDIAADLFAAEGELPASLTGVAGTVEVDRKVVRDINRRPGDFYFNLHNAEFAGGAVRGQLFRS
jgi:hypothetical protein